MEGECYEVVWGANYTFDNIYIKHSFCWKLTINH
jgi:hypothetical protein